MTQIGLDITDLLAQAHNLPGDFAAAELTNSPRVVAADRVLDLRGSVETYFAFRRAVEAAYYLGLNGHDGADAALLDDMDAEADLQAYLGDWNAHFEDIREDVTLSYRQTFFLVTEGFTPAELTAWTEREEHPWAQSFEAAFQAGYLEAYQQSIYRQGQAVAAYDTAETDD